MSKVFFGNSILSKISVNVNNALLGTVLSARPDPSPLAQSTSVYGLNISMAAFDIGPNPDKGKFANSGENRVQIITEDSGAAQYGVTIVDQGLKGQDLYFYVFDNTLVGQNNFGTAQGIKVTQFDTNATALQ